MNGLKWWLIGVLNNIKKMFGWVFAIILFFQIFGFCAGLGFGGFAKQCPKLPGKTGLFIPAYYPGCNFVIWMMEE